MIKEVGLKVNNNLNSLIRKKNPFISVITVVYNSGLFLERTIQSIINQTYDNIEYIIIDGGSADNTLNIIKKYENYIAYWLSEPDNGLYDAMNKGINKATGDYLWFINSGDQIYSSDTLELIFKNNNEYSDVYYGKTIIIDNNNIEIGDRRHKAPDSLTWKSFSMGMLVSHQSIIVKKEIASGYDLKYKFSADFDWVIKVLKRAKSIHNSHLILSKIVDEGITKQNIIPGLKERFQIMKMNYGFLPVFFRHFIIFIKFFYYLIRHRRF